MKAKLLGGIVAIGVMVAPASAQAFTVWSQNFEDVKPANALTSQSLPAANSLSWTRLCAPGAHTGQCFVRLNTTANNTDTVLRQNATVQGRGGGNNIQLRFWQNRDTEFAFDGMVLETSLNGGPWVDYTTRPGAGAVQNGYNGTIVNGFGSTIAGRSAWTGSSGGYVRSVVNLGTLVQKDSVLRWRFRVATDVSLFGTGVSLDDIVETASDGAYSPPVQPGDGKVG